MIKFTDDFFRFPIKVYHSFSLKKAMEEEDKEDSVKPIPIDWIIGYAKIPVKDMIRTMWYDGFSRERTVEDVAKDGFDLTIVINEIWGEYTCSWPRKKFEEKLDEFMRQYDLGNPYFSLPPRNLEKNNPEKIWNIQKDSLDLP